MRVRIRGHYRIDANGRVVPVIEKHDSVLPYCISPPPGFTPREGKWDENFVELCALLVMFGIMILISLLIAPIIQRAVVTAQAAQAASARALIIQQQARHTANPQTP